jgi:hypothetical protein
MRTTVTLDPDAEALVRRLMSERGMSLEQAVNHAIRAGLGGSASEEPSRTPTFRMGFEPGLPSDKGLQVAAELEDEELTHRAAPPR